MSKFKPTQEMCDSCNSGDCIECNGAIIHAALRTLKRLRYKYCGGEIWKPPINEPPNLNLVEYWRVRATLIEAWLAKLADPADYPRLQALLDEDKMMRGESDNGRDTD